MIVNTALESILDTATDISTVCEIYGANATPTVNGFDPATALGCFAAADGVVFSGRTYTRLVEKFGNIKRTITDEVNTASVTFSNVSRVISTFEFSYGFEGLIMVIRVLSRGRSVALTDTQIIFAGRCDKPTSGNKESLTVTARFITGAQDVFIPRRTFGPEDHEGRATNDVEFEGFIYTPQYGSVSFPREVHTGGFLGFWNRRQVIATQPYSNYTDIDANKSVPEVFGRTQMLGIFLAATDVGTQIRFTMAFCEGPIEDVIDYPKSLNPALPLSAPSSYVKFKGVVGVANGNDPAWPGGLSYNSRTAGCRSQQNNSLVSVNDPPSDVLAQIKGKIITIPDGAGVWNTQLYSNNPAAVAYHVMTSPYYLKLDANWIDEAKATECFNFNAELIFNTGINDFTFV